MPRTKPTLFDMAALAERQLATDRAKTRRFPDFFTRKLQRMSTSPLAFLRGAAPLFYELLDANDDLAAGPPGEGWIVGDLHLENFGAYRPDWLETKDKKRWAVFNLNDFDDTLVGPWRLDVLRLTTSLLLGARELGADGLLALALVDRMMLAWARAAFDGEPPPDPPAPVAALVAQVCARTRGALLDGRTTLVHRKRKFVRGPRYADLSAEVRAAVPQAFERYFASLPAEDRPVKGSHEILDAALRIAGTGSLGGLRIAVLVEGKGGRDGQWIFDLKEQGTPSAALLVGAPKLDPAVRVVTGLRACLAHPLQTIGTTRLGKKKPISLFGRRLAPQEDKLNLRKLHGPDLPELATYLGALLGAAHARGATKAPSSPWSKSDRETLRANAITLAGVHEGVYLALCDRMQRILS